MFTQAATSCMMHSHWNLVIKTKYKHNKGKHSYPAFIVLYSTNNASFLGTKWGYIIFVPCNMEVNNLYQGFISPTCKEQFFSLRKHTWIEKIISD